MTRLHVLRFRIAAALLLLAACGDSDADSQVDAGGVDAAADAEAAACAVDEDILEAECTDCLCKLCPAFVAACDDACVRYVDCLAGCAGAVEDCAAQCNGGELTPETPEVSNFAICLGNLCNSECL